MKRGAFDRRLWFSYLTLVMLLVCLVSASSYALFRKMYRNTVDETNKRLLEATAALYEEQIFKPLGKLYADFLVTSDKSGLINRFYNDHDAVLEPMEVYSVNNYLRTAVVSNEVLNSVHFYSSDTGRLFSSRYGYIGGEDAAAALEQLSFEPGSCLDQEYPVISQPFCFPGESVFYYHVIYPSRMNVRGKNGNTGYILFTLDCERAGEWINGMEDSEIYIVDSTGTVLCGLDGGVVGSKMEISLDAEGNYSRSIEGDVVISCLRSSVKEHYFVIKNSTGSFYPAVGQLVVQMVCIALLMAAVGIGVAVWFSRQVSKPIVQIVSTINNALPDEKQCQKSDLEGIVEAICDEFHSLEQFTRNNKESIKNNFLMSLYLDQCVSGQDMADKLSYIGFRTDCEGYRALLLHVKVPEQAGIEAVQMAIYKYIHDLQTVEEGTMVIASEVENHMIAVLCAEADYELVQRYVQEEREGLSACVYQGKPLQAYQTAGASMSYMRQMIKYEFFYPDRTVWTEEELEEYENGILKEEPPFQEFVKQLKGMNLEFCRNCLTEVLAGMDMQRVSADERQKILLKLISCISDTARAMNYRLDSLEQLIGAEDIRVFEQRFQKLLEEYERIVNSGQQEKKAAEIEAIKAYIHKNYDKDISLGMIAEDVRMHPAYVSRFFKEQTGQNITEYIKEIKLVEAEKLIVSTEESIEKIAGKIGYNTTHYFIRQFKEKYGETPVAYRKSHKR